MGIKFSNNARGQLNANITATATSLTLKSGEGSEFPSIGTAGTDYFYITLVDSSGNREVMCVVNKSVDTLTIGVAGVAGGAASVSGRGQEGTTALSFAADDIVDLRLTAQGLDDLYDEANTTSAELIKGGDTELDGDKVDIDFTPSNYSPSTTPTEVTDADHLSAHLAGIDDELGSLDTSLGTKASADGDKLDIDWNPSNYTPDASIPEASDVDDLSAHLKGIDTALAAAVPSGAVMPFAMESAPTGWLECDGSAISRTTYSKLYAAIGTVFGKGDGSTTFNLPDMRGQFARGWDHSAGTDPDAASRTDSGDGSTTGDHVGTKQAHTIESHHHGTTKFSGTSFYVDSGSAYGGAYYALTHAADTTNNTGGNETRPVNINLMYCIKV